MHVFFGSKVKVEMARESEEYTPNYSITKDELIQDIDFYTSKIKEMHGNPFRLISEEEFNLKAEEIKARIRSLKTDSIHVLDCYYFLQELAISIQDGHTEIFTPSNWEKTFSCLFPLKVVSIDNRVFISENLAEGEIPERAEMMSINDKSIQEMIKETMRYIAGTLQHYKRVKWTRNLGLFLHTYFKMEPPWLVTYRNNGIEISVELAGLDRQEYRKRAFEKRAYSESSFTVDGEVVPVLNLPSLSYGKLEDFEKFLDDFFKKHKDRQYLVIDIRRCPGGNGAWGWLVLDYLIDTPYLVMTTRRDKASEYYKEFVKDFFDNYGDKIDELYGKIYRGILDAELSTYFEIEKRFHEPKKTEERFGGMVFLLTSHETFSAGVVFAAAFQYNKMGTIVGRETGGRVDFLSDPKDVELLNSKLRAKIPVAVIVLPGLNPGRGIIPDITVACTLEDYVDQVDVDIETVKELIKNDLLTISKEDK